MRVLIRIQINKYVCVCMYIYIYMCVCVCIYIYIYTHVFRALWALWILHGLHKGSIRVVQMCSDAHLVLEESYDCVTIPCAVV